MIHWLLQVLSASCQHGQGEEGVAVEEKKKASVTADSSQFINV